MEVKSRLRAAVGVLLLWPYVLIASVPVSSNLSADQSGGRPHVAKRSIQSCESTFSNYCLNSGQCMLLMDFNEHHCKCEKGFYGPRCGKVELVMQPIAEEQIVLIVFCVGLLIVGLSGVLYLCCKWLKRKKFPKQQKRQSCKGVQSVNV